METMSVQDLIDKARAAADEKVTTSATVVVADAKVSLTFTKMLGAEWSALVAVHPPRAGSVTDASLGFNFDAVAGKYPAANVTIDGDVPVGNEWAELYGLLETPWRNVVQTKLFDMHQSGPARKLIELGKVSSGAGSRKKRN